MEEEAVPEGDDALFAYNLRKLRERAGMSQAALADAMRARGRPWHQSTTGRIETGRQPPSYSDARAAAAIFGVPVERFAWKPGEANAVDWLDMESGRLKGSFTATAHAVAAQLSAARLAGRALEGTAGYATPRVLEARETLEDAIREYGAVEDAVEEGLELDRNLHESGEENDGTEDTQSEPGLVDQQRA